MNTLNLSVDLRKELAKRIVDFWQSDVQSNAHIIDLILQNDGSCYNAVLCQLEEAWITSESFSDQSMNCLIKAVFHDLICEVELRYSHYAVQRGGHHVSING